MASIAPAAGTVSGFPFSGKKTCTIPVYLREIYYTLTERFVREAILIVSRFLSLYSSESGASLSTG
jgi:hypothetical protein